MTVPVVVLVSLLMLTGQAQSASWADNCSPGDIFDGGCEVAGNLGDGEAVLDGSTRNHGSPGGTGSPGDPATATPALDPNAPAPDCSTNAPICRDDWAITAPVTLIDIAAFRPTPAIDAMQPNGWAVIGLHTNFFATGGTQVIDGTLLGQPASVRFTPVSWTWSYGDGTSATRATGGASWRALGIAEFDPTPTSHVYAAPGSYTIDLTVNYAAEYQFAGAPWVRIAGTLPVATNQLVAVAGGAKTVLVERECTVNPSGPGC